MTGTIGNELLRWVFGLAFALALVFPAPAAGASSSGGDQRGGIEQPVAPPQGTAGSESSTNRPLSEVTPPQVREQRTMGSFEFRLSLIVLGFGVVVVLCEFLLLRNRTLSAADVLRIFSVTLIIIGTFFLVTAGFDAQQIAPAMGLLGTVAGYLLGQRGAERMPERFSDARDVDKSASN